MTIDFAEILEYARKFPEMRLIGRRPVDLSRLERSGTPIDGPVDSIPGIEIVIGDVFGENWSVRGFSLRRNQIDVECSGPGIDTVFILSAPDGPSLPFDRRGLNIGYQESETPFEIINAVGNVFADWIVSRVKNEFSWDKTIKLIKDARMDSVHAEEPNVHLIERRPDGKVYVRMTDACQERCVFCFFYDTPQESDFAGETNVDHELPAALERIDPSRTSQLILTGGEPTLVSEFDQLLTRLLERGFGNIVVQTNGILTARRGFLDKFSRYNDRLSFGFSLHAATAGTSALVTGVESETFFSNKIESVTRAVKLGYMTKITCVITRYNLHELADIACLCAGLPDNTPVAADNVVLQFSMPSIRGLMTRNRDAYPRIGEVATAVRPALEMADNANLRVSFSSLCSIPPCALPDRLKHIESMWYREGPSEWWETERSFGRSCDQCVLKNWCSGVSPAYADWFGDDELVPFTHESTRIVTPD